MEDRTQVLTLRWFTGWLTAVAVVGLIVSVVNLFNPIGHDDATTRLITWPTMIHPTWAGCLAALGAVIALGQICSKVGRRDASKAGRWYCAQCPLDGHVAPGIGAGQDHCLATGHTIKAGDRPQGHVISREDHAA